MHNIDSVQRGGPYKDLWGFLNDNDIQTFAVIFLCSYGYIIIL